MDYRGLVGEWIGHYRAHFEEVVRIQEIDGLLVAIKVTGDDHVPAGETTWRVNMETGVGEGQIAGEGFLSPRFIPGRLSILTRDKIVFHWKDCGQVEYRRDD